MSEKPGCIHPGDPEGCIGTCMKLGLLAVLVAAVIVVLT